MKTAIGVSRDARCTYAVRKQLIVHDDRLLDDYVRSLLPFYCTNYITRTFYKSRSCEKFFKNIVIMSKKRAGFDVHKKQYNYCKAEDRLVKELNMKSLTLQVATLVKFLIALKDRSTSLYLSDQTRSSLRSFVHDKYAEFVKPVFEEARQIGLMSADPYYLGFVLEFSTSTYDLFNDLEEAKNQEVSPLEDAKKIAREAFNGALEQLGALEESARKDSEDIMQRLRNNLTIWTPEDSDFICKYAVRKQLIVHDDRLLDDYVRSLLPFYCTNYITRTFYKSRSCEKFFKNIVIMSKKRAGFDVHKKQYNYCKAEDRLVKELNMKSLTLQVATLVKFLIALKDRSTSLYLSDQTRSSLRSFVHDKYAEFVKPVFEEARQIGLMSADPYYLGFVLEFSTSTYDLFNDLEEAKNQEVSPLEDAKKIAREAFNGALEQLGALEESARKDSEDIMQRLRNNLTIWTPEDSDFM